MKKFQTILLAAFVMLGSSVFAAGSTEPVVEKSTTISKEIGKYLGTHDLKLQEEVTVQVLFTVNRNNEIVVLEVDTEEVILKNFIQNRLNYKKLDNEAVVGKNYTLPVRIKKSEV